MLSLFPSQPRPSKGPFISSQRLLQLIAPVDKRRECLEPGRFREARLEREAGSGPELQLPEGCRWREARGMRREALLVDRKKRHRRLCLVIDAGVGKTTAVQQAGYLRSVLRPGHLAIGVPFSELPEHPDDFLGERGLLVRQLRLTPDLADVDRHVLLDLVRRKIRQGDFTLLADAMDQRGDDPGLKDFGKRASALADFLQSYPSASCVVSGRPKAIADAWDKLFKREPFEFVQVGCFDEEEAEQCVGEERWKKVQAVGADFLSVPRMLEVVRGVKPHQLDGVRTEADLYWPAVEASIEKMFAERKTGIDRADAKQLLSLLAIEMVRADGDPIQGIAGAAEFKKFTRSVFERRKRQQDLQEESPLAEHENVAAFRAAILELAALNEGLECAVMDDAGEKQLYFRDMTLRDFFAALWCSRYATPQDVEWLRGRQHLRGEYGRHHREALRYPFWRLLSGMPRAACNPVVWVHSASTLFITPPGRTVVRSTEMMHTAWPRLLEIAAYDDAPRVTGEALDRWLQGDVFQRVESGKLSFAPAAPLPSSASEAARHVCDQYLAEFASRALGRYGPEADQAIAKKLHNHGFGDPIEAGDFAMGSDEFGNDPKHESHIARPYQLSRTPLTNEQMRLFDPNREMRFAPYSDYSPGARCPAIFVSWYDAWAAALWLHAGLPSEQHWECACRGPEGRHKHWKHGWFASGDTKELGRRAWCKESEGGKFSTIAVDERWSGSAPENDRSPYGLLHLLGNVWEWTASAYKADPRDAWTDSTYAGVSSRVLRGGAFGNDAGHCRAANRYDGHPSSCGRGLGVRLFRSG